MTVILHVCRMRLWIRKYCKLCIYGFFHHLIGKRLSYVCVCAYLKVVSILQWEALSFQPDSFALFGSDAVDALVVVIVVGGEVRREQNAFWS